MSDTRYHPGKLKPFAQIVAQTIRNHPRALEDPDLLWSLMVAAIPGIGKKESCPNCSASMIEYDRHVDLFVALLLQDMARIVRKRVEGGMPFTDANKIRINAETQIGHEQKVNTSNARVLGLVAKVLRKGSGTGKDGKPRMVHDNNQWAITSRGWKALAGKPVPEHVTVFRNQILEHFDTEITLPEVFENHTARMREKEQAGKLDDSKDHRGDYALYDMKDWVEFAGYHRGDLL